MNSRKRPALWALLGVVPAAALVATGVASVLPAAAAGGAPSGAPSSAQTLSFFAFDINNGSADPGFIPVPGSNPKALAQGDELIINDQVTTTHKVNGGYPIVGYDSGVCTLTRIPEPHARQTLADCVVTAVVKNGSLTVQGVVRFSAMQPQSATMAITGGTGHFATARGTLRVSFAKTHKILTFSVR